MVQGGNESLLRGINFAALVMDGVELKSLQEPCRALEEVGAIVRIVSAANGKVTSVDQDQDADSIEVQLSFDEADPQEFSAVLIPGGRRHVELLRKHSAAHHFIKGIAQEAKPIAVSGDGLALLIDASLLQNRTVAGPDELKNEVMQAGGNWSKKGVEVNGSLITSTGADQLNDFIQTLLAVTANHVKESVKGTLDEKAVVGPSS